MLSLLCWSWGNIFHWSLNYFINLPGKFKRIQEYTYTHAIEMFAFGKFPNSSWSWIWMSTWGRLKPIFRTYSFDKLHWSRHFSFTGGWRRKLSSVQIMHLGLPDPVALRPAFFRFVFMELQLCHISLGEVSCLDEWFMCWAAAAWWAAVRVSRAVLQQRFGQKKFFKIFPHLAWWSPYMLVGGISMPLGHPSYWKINLH